MMKLLIILLFISVGVNAQIPVIHGTVQSGGGLTTYLSDQFTDANGTSLASHTMNVGSGWTISLDGLACTNTVDITIQSNRAKPNSGLYSIAWADATVSDGVASMDMIVPNNSNYLGAMVFRYSSCANYWLVGIERDGGGTPYMAIYKVQAGAVTVESTVNVPAATNTTLNLKVTLSGNSIIALAGTGETCNTSNSFNSTATKFGVFGYSDATYTATIAGDNFLVTN